MAADTYTSSVTLDIEGMTCAGCVSRVERKLNELDSVEASVNLATECASTPSGFSSTSWSAR